MHRFSRPAVLILVIGLLLSMSGCYTGNIDQYFSLPRLPEEYRQLQELIDREIADGCAYAAPVRGSYRQSVQLMDLNGDGRDEAMAFLRSGDSQLQIVIFAVQGDGYRKALTLREEGRSIGRVDFADMDRDGSADLVVAWQLSTGMSMLSVYSLRDWSGRLLMSTDCTEFAVGDLDRNGQADLVVLRSAGVETYMADMYTLNQTLEPQALTAALSGGISELERTRLVTIGGGQSALLVEAAMSSGELVTDLLVYREGALVNLTMNRSTGVSGTRRSNHQIYSQDIDGDGATEIPHPQQLYNQGGETQWSVAWYRYDISGRAKEVMTTYHCVTDGWYLVLPKGWDEGLTVRRTDALPGEHTVVLSRLGADGIIHDLMAVYAITGEGRSERSDLPGRFLLEESSSTVFAAQLLDETLDRADMKARFHIIYTEWSNGSV